MIARRLAFRSFVDYAASVRHAVLDVQILARESRAWRLDRRRLGDVLLERGAEGAPYLATVSPAWRTLCFTFTADTGDGRSLDAWEAGDRALCRLAGGARASLVVRRPGEWFAVVAGASAVATLGGDPDPEPGTSVVIPRPERLASLRALASRALEASEGHEGTAAGASASLGRTLLGEALAAFADGSRAVPPPSHARIGRRPVLERLEEFLARRASEPLYVAELCEATGLPERTLRFILAEQYGTSPVRLLRNRRLCQLRHALLGGADSDQSVAAIATRFGFRHMGQLAADYRALFGEAPSATLRRSREGEPLEALAPAEYPEAEPAYELVEPT
ncbi:helix-turn-helix domain-containing protein [Acidobacteria bacterium ACD]|nr:MAG: AraC family transcriptional regulator [Acidobacteriota bacterium]MDL1952382.1 helix-turn-helix domain-containing protein [Acidobacteria bacterium ACD]